MKIKESGAFRTNSFSMAIFCCFVLVLLLSGPAHAQNSPER